MFTYSMLYLMLLEAEDRVKNFPNEDVRKRSQETIDLIHQRMEFDGLTREQLKKIVTAIG